MAMLLLQTGKAQMSGSYAVPGAFADLATAISSLNTVGVSGPVTIDIAAAYTETVPVGGFTLNAIAGVSSVNTIIFQKSGVGANPILYAYAGGTAVPSSAEQDGIWKFNGSDYITLDGIDLMDPNTANPATMEFGYGFFKASVIDGCNNNTIKNCVITLNRVNTSAGAGPAMSGCRGIDMVNAGISTHTTAMVITSGSGIHSANTFSANTILSCNIGIADIGFADIAPYILSDLANNIVNNIIGPVASNTNNIANSGIVMRNILGCSISGNVIQNLNGGGTGISTQSVYISAISNNTIQNFTSSGGAGNGGIYIATSSNCSLTSNIVQTFTFSSVQIHGINVNSSNTLIAVSHNTVINLTNTGTTTNANNVVSAIYVGNAVLNATLNANVISNIYNSNVNGYGIRGIVVNTGNAASNINIRNNFISDVYSWADAAVQYWCDGIALEGASTGGINVDFNTVHLFRSFAGYNGASGSAAMYVNSGGGNINIRNNIFVNTFNNTTVTGDINYGIYSGVANTNFGTVNYNDYYVAGATSIPVLGYLGSNQTTLLGIQTVFGGNLNSKNILPIFVSNTDLHVQAVLANATLDNQGNTLTGITTDIDNQVRNLTTPDIGADEFTTPSCTGANGGVLGATSATACAGQVLVANVSGFSTGLTSSYMWKVGATSGGPYFPVTGGSGSATASYTSDPLGAGVYYVVFQAVCAVANQTAVSNEGTLTVNAIPTATAASVNPTICAGQNIFLGALGTATSFTWTGPSSFSSTSAATVITAAGLNTSGTYSLVGSNGSCSSTVATILIKVNPMPLPLSVSPAAPSVCTGGSQTLTSIGGAVNPTLSFGTQANQNSASTGAAGYPAPYTAYYGGQRMQMLILASELASAGFVANTPITNIQFPVVSKGANWGGTINDNQGFQVNVGATSLNSLATFQGGLTNVVAPMNYAPLVGTNTHVFSAPYIWNGTSNLIIETTWSNNFAGAGADLVVSYNSPTGFPSTIVYRVDNQTAGFVAAATTVDFIYSARPDFKLNGTTLGTFSWSPGTGLSSTTSKTVVATPATTTNYTVTSTLGTCSTNTNVTVTLVAPPALTVATTATAVCAGDAATLTASGATTFTWNGSPGTNTLSVTPLVTTIYTVFGNAGSCAAVSETISVTSNSLPVVSAVGSSTAICIGQTATLTASGASTYVWVSGPSASVNPVSPASTTNYTVVGTSAEGCVGQQTVDLVVNTLPSLSISPLSATICASTPVSFTASGAVTYSWSSGSTAASTTVTPVNSGTYMVTGTNAAGCSATETVAVTTKASPTIVISPTSASVCAGGSVSFTASGATTYTWNSGSAVASETVTPVNSGTYMVTGTNNVGCFISKTISVTVNALPNVAILPASPTICVNESITLTGSGASTYSWMTNGNVTTTTLSVNPASATSYTLEGVSAENCKASKSVTVTVDPCTGLKEQTVLNGNVSLYPNPSTGVINATFGFDGRKEIFVVNSVGALIFKITTEEQATSFDLSDYAKGVYFVTVKTNGASANYKIVIQ